jgi:hypothetical protein
MRPMKTPAQEQADRITHGNIARVRAMLNAETNEGKRTGLEKLLAEQEGLLTRTDQDGASW